MFTTSILLPYIDPVALKISAVNVHWYGISYLLGILLGWYYLKYICKKTEKYKIQINISDLSEKVKFYSKNDKLRKKIAKNGKKKYFKIFNEKKISKYMIDISLGKTVTLF